MGEGVCGNWEDCKGPVGLRVVVVVGTRGPTGWQGPPCFLAHSAKWVWQGWWITIAWN